MLLPNLPANPPTVIWRALDQDVIETSAVELADGRVLVVWSANYGFSRIIRAGHAASVGDFLGFVGSVTTTTDLVTLDGVTTYGWVGSCVQRIGADLYLTIMVQPTTGYPTWLPASAIYDASIPAPGGDDQSHGVFVYRSVDEGATWVQHATLNCNQLYVMTGTWGGVCRQGEIYVDPVTGRWIVTHQTFEHPVFGLDEGGVGGISISDDQGATWTLVFQYGNKVYGGHPYRQVTRGPDGNLYAAMTKFCQDGLVHSTDDGSSWSVYQTIGCSFDDPIEAGGPWHTGQDGASSIIFTGVVGGSIFESLDMDPTTSCASCAPGGPQDWSLIHTWTNPLQPADHAQIVQPIGDFAVYIDRFYVASWDLPAGPVAVDDTYSTAYGTPLVELAPGVLLNDTGTALTVTSSTIPANGVVAQDPDGSFVYTPNPGFAGFDTYTYTVTDAWGRTATATVTIHVLPAPSPPAGTPVCTGIGAGAVYAVGLFSRMSGALICMLDERANITWGRRLDRPSTATVTIRDDCCACVPVPWAHEIGIYRDGQLQPVWQGPVTGPTEQTGRQIVIPASDKSAYWFRRDTGAVHAHAGAPVDAGTLFASLVADAETGVPSGLAFTPIAPTGTMVERTINTNEKIGPHLDDLSNDGIDWTVVGLQCYAGGVTISAGGALVLETRDHWEDPPTVISDGRQQATRVLVHAQGDILGVWPPGPLVVDPVFGILEEDISRPQIASQAEADAYAQSYYLRHQGPVVGITTGQAVLSKRFPYAMADLIPGRLFNVLVNTECDDTLLTLRLAELNVDAAEGVETAVRIDLQPVGQMDPVETP